ncbi:phage major capsid protein [Morganella morganii]|uniref:phage major capsid protein n=1 Tax=Morganella morganii TaxID=582 RepID=UPI000F82CA0B|nr:phage major capsid protein [Morganella morganii]EKL3980185.1 phage major capsid protein [Morganella morganii]ELB1016422.1 phage major capsid protein [Morganella morganii]RTY34741.1 phage major capsid protein [Morganella morganii subsp. morganii]HDS7240981.1 phage major capsid protein [Morganella morganii subsp. morganii]HEI8864104.1 phage major capsid protein [Morganella morganii]
MAVDHKDVSEVAKELKSSFEEFQKKNDKRIDAIESEKGKLAESVDTLNGKLSELDELKSSLEAELAAVKRPGGGVASKDVAEHKSAFELFVRKGKDDGLAELEQKAMQTGTDPDGGYAVPEELDRNIITALRDEVVMRQECNVVSVGTPSYKRLVNKGGTGSGWVGETDARPETNTSKIGTVEPVWGEIYGNPAATQTMLDDAFFNVEQFITGELAIEFAEQEEAAFTNGDGSKKPKGLLAYGSDDKGDKDREWGKLQHLLLKKPDELTADEVMQLVYTLRKPYRNGAKFMMNNSTLFKVRTLKDSQGNYLWQPGLQLGQPSALLGYGIAENEQFADMAAGAAPLAFGNFKRCYTILDRIGIRMLRDPYTNKPFVHFYTTKRVGSMMVDSNAVKLLKAAAGTK